jgi:hypothetical protein
MLGLVLKNVLPWVVDLEMHYNLSRGGGFNLFEINIQEGRE